MSYTCTVGPWHQKRIQNNIYNIIGRELEKKKDFEKHGNQRFLLSTKVPVFISLSRLGITAKWRAVLLFYG